MKLIDREKVRLLVGFLRSLRRWTQHELANATGLDRKTIGRYESGETTPSPEALERLATAAGVSPRRLDQLLELFGRISEESDLEEAGKPSSDHEKLAAEIAFEIAAEIEPEILSALDGFPLKG